MLFAAATPRERARPVACRLLAGLVAAIAVAGLVVEEPQSTSALASPAGLIDTVAPTGPGRPMAGAALSNSPTALAPPGAVGWEPLGGVLDGGPAAASWASGRLDVFVTGTDRQLWHRWYEGAWSGWEVLGGGMSGGPAVASWGPGRLDVFARTTDGQLWHRFYAGVWSGWEPLGGVLDDRPAVASWGPGRLDVFVTGTDGQLWHRWYAGVWSQWEVLGGRLSGGPAVASWSAGRLDVFARGTDGQLWHRWYAGGWSEWEALGGLLDGGPAVASWSAGRLDVFVTGTDGQLWHRWYEGAWSVWETLGGRLSAGPAVSSWAPGRLDVLAKGADRQLLHTWYDGGWASPRPLSVVVDGTGNGHGRGLSQWGSFGWAVNYRLTWQQILAHYYGGTVLGSTANSPIRVRLLALDDAVSTGVISTTGAAMWNGVGYGALEAWEVVPNVYEIWGSSTPRCPGVPEGWSYLQTVNGPVTFTTPWDESTAVAGDVLGVCRPDGSIVHYRGSITALNDATGANRTVNEVLVENYTRGVVPREVPASWGNSGNGAGMNALERAGGGGEVVRSVAEPLSLRQDVRHVVVPGLRRGGLPGERHGAAQPGPARPATRRASARTPTPRSPRPPARW